MAHLTFFAISLLNEFGEFFWELAFMMLIESSILFVLLVVIDLLVLRKQRTVIRSATWSLLLIKLAIPTSLPGPLSIIGIDDRQIARFLSSVIPTPAQTTLQEWMQSEDLADVPSQGTSIDLAHGVPIPPFGSVVLPQTTVMADETIESELLQPELLWQGGLFAGWMAVVSLLTCVLIVRIIQVRRLIRSSELAKDDLQSLFRDVQRTLKIGSCRVQLRTSHVISSPALCGLWNTTILIPESLSSVLSPEQLRLILVHELIHWRRGDLYWSTAQSLLQIANFYNPVVWVTNSLLRRLREYSVDEETVVVSGSTVQDYTTALVETTALLRLNRTRPALSLGVVESRSALTSRVQRLLSRKLPTKTRIGWRGFAATILLAMILLPLSGCHRSIFALFDPTLASNEFVTLPTFDFPVDSRQHAQLHRNEDGLADAMLQQEQLTERKLVAEGLVDKRLAAAGITEIAPDELVGIVVDADLQPIAGASVVDDHCCCLGESVTDGQGIFRFKDYDTESGHHLLISKAGHSPRIIMGKTPDPNHLLVILGNQTCLEGVVTDSDHNPVKGARIVATCGRFKYAEGHSSRTFPFEAISDDHGRYRIPLCSNRYDIKVVAPGIGAARQSGVVVQPNQSLNQPIQLEKGIRFEATVLDSQTGQPFEGFVLYTNDSPSMSARSDTQGGIVIENLFPGVIEFWCGAGDKLVEGDKEYWLNGSLGRWWSADTLHPHQNHYFRQEFAWDSNHKEKWLLWNANSGELTFDLKPDMKSVKILVERGVTISGTVTDPEGRPVKDASVGGVLSGTGGSLGNFPKATTDELGRYRTVLPAGHKIPYNLVAHDGDRHETRTWANGISKSLQTRPGQTIEDVNIQLTVPGVIRGRITSSGKPVAGRTVYSTSYEGSENLHFEPQAETAADGSFELTHVRPGKRYVQAGPLHRVAEFDPKGFRIVEVKAGATAGNVDLDFKEE